MASGGIDDFVLVAAIDFGTTFSGYAFSFIATKEHPDLPEKIRTNKSWGASLGFQSYKTPTSVLTTKSGKFLDFGFDAEQKYSEALEEGEDVDPDMLLFRHFKMMLHKREKVTLSSTISSVDGTITPALDIFAHALRYLKDHLLDAIKLETGSKPEPALIRWVITVPAIWSDKSKQFMREAAFKAGCITEKDSRKLVIALEPEAASLCCRRLNIAQYASTADISFPVGTKYLVLDCGGGTVDITAHVTEFDKKVKELLQASGGSWGGTKVDQHFVEFMESVLGKNFLNTYRKQCPQEWLQFLTHFEKIKKSFKPDGKSKISISLPWSMGDIYASTNKGKSIKVALKEAADKGISFSQGLISIKYDVAKTFFDPVVTDIVHHVRKLRSDSKLRGLKYILMVGGFSECLVLQQAIMEAFGGNGLKVLIPGEAQLAIIKGAVLFGHSPNEIKSRIATKTYGCAIKLTFNPKLHEASRRFIDIDGVETCDSIFEVLVAQGSEMSVGEIFKHKGIVTTGYTRAVIPIYATELKPDSKTAYTDQVGMTKLGEIIITTLERGKVNEVLLSLKFGSTEIEVEAVEVSTGKSAKTTIDFLS